jgi:autotransporter-associated beta strand protein
MRTRLTNRPAKLCVTLLALGALTAGVQQARAAQKVWNNMGTDFNTAADWTGGLPSGSNVAYFSLAVVDQPNLSADISTSGLFFAGASTSGYDITNSAGAILTLTGYNTSTGSSGTADGSAVAIRNEITSGTNTVDAPLMLAPASGSTSVFYQVGGGTLVVNGTISSAANVDLSLKGSSGGTIQLNGANSFSTGSIDSAGQTVVVGNDSGLGAGTFSVNSTATLQAGGGARTIANNIVLNGNTTLSGNNAFTFNGSTTSAGSASRALTVSNTGGATFGNVFLSNDATARGLTISGSSAVVVNGVIANNSADNAVASALSYSGSSTLTLNNANTYSGKTTISSGTVIANHDGALGTGNISLTGGNVTLTMQNGATNQYTGIGAAFSLVMADIINLNYTGTNVVGSLIVDGVSLAPGLYGAGAGATSNPDMAFFGSGYLLVGTPIPEPSVYMLLGVGLLICGQRFFRRRSVS